MTQHNDAFQKLEDKVLRVAEILKKTREENRALEEELKEHKSGTKEDSKRVTALEKENESLRRERDEVRARVEKIIRQIDVLTTPEAEG